MPHPKRKHHHKGKELPHLHDAIDPSTGKATQTTLVEGSKAWIAAIEAGEFELETVTELPIPGDPTRDVLVIVRHKLK